MHNGQLKVFFVGGPNVRQDYHIEEGEELFFMMKGNMCLKVIEGDTPRDIHIKEGEMFLLPAKIQHSPQREADTVGLVIERERLSTELDGLRYFVQNTFSKGILFERWFHCEDLGTQLKPIITEFFNSEEYKTQTPQKGSVCENPPYSVDKDRKLMTPFPVTQWLQQNRAQLDSVGYVSLFEGSYKSTIGFYGRGRHDISTGQNETYLWQWTNGANLTFWPQPESGQSEERNSSITSLNSQDSVLIPKNSGCILINEEGGLTLSVTMSTAPGTVA